jgi:hypothetical protein
MIDIKGIRAFINQTLPNSQYFNILSRRNGFGGRGSILSPSAAFALVD